jgi:DNA-directed RNA polymerase specialized sigma subunit
MESIGGAGRMDKKVNYDMDYTAEQVHRMILHKNSIIDLKQQGNFKAAESLLDLQMLEERYLTHNQRTVIYYVYERGHTIKQTAELLNTTKSKVVEILDSLLPTLQKYLRSDIL